MSASAAVISGRYICGVSPSASADPDFAPPPPSAPLSSHTQWLESTLGPATEEDYANMWEDLIWPTMAQRVPAFQALKVGEKICLWICTLL